MSCIIFGWYVQIFICKIFLLNFNILKMEMYSFKIVNSLLWNKSGTISSCTDFIKIYLPDNYLHTVLY